MFAVSVAVPNFSMQSHKRMAVGQVYYKNG